MKRLYLLSLFLTPLMAHHGAAAYDLATSKALDATITNFDWSNPHGLIEFAAADADGTVRHWTAETAGLTILIRAGWSKAILQTGARINVVGHPAKNGSPTMILERVVLQDGRVLNNFVPR